MANIDLINSMAILIDLSGNELTELAPRLFDELSRLATLYLNNNQLIELDSTTFASP